MKQKIYILGLATAMIITLGTMFKVNHWPGAGILLIGGISVLVILFLPVALVNSLKDDNNKSKRLLYFIIWLTSFVLFAAMLFKIQHWPWAGYLMLISIPFPFLVFLPVFLIVTSKNREHSIFDTAYILFLLMILSCFTALLALNVSKEKLVESFSIVRTYYNSEKDADKIKVQQQSPVSQKIDEVIAITEEYRDLYLKFLNIQADMWNGDLGDFQSSFSFSQPSGKKDRQAGEIHSKLLLGLTDLISIMEATPGCEPLAASAPAVFSLRKTPGGNYNWNSDLILAPVHPWLIAYLEGLANNLKLIRATMK